MEAILNTLSTVASRKSTPRARAFDLFEDIGKIERSNQSIAPRVTGMTMVWRFAVCEQDRCWEGAMLIAGLNAWTIVCSKTVVLALDGCQELYFYFT